MGFYKATKQSQSKTLINTFQENIDNYQEISLGVKPVAGGDAEKWAQQVIEEPMPISYTLISICEAVAGTIRGLLDPSLKANCEKALGADEYCTKRLKDQRKD